MSLAQTVYDSSMMEGTKKKAAGFTMASCGAFLSLGTVALTAGLTAAAAAPVLATFGVAGVLAMVAGREIHKQGVQRQEDANNEHAIDMKIGLVQKKGGFLGKLTDMRNKFLASDSDNKLKM